ncbi:MAG: hypothetical protein CSB21_03545 [Deltaproteobacteria bacterium]|nr:MAG: hypothetical protein CSB21_03545 [Deltaproteobacteria bacterium]
MKKNMCNILLLFLFLIPFEVYGFKAENVVVYLKDKSRILSEEFNLPVDEKIKGDVYDPYVKVTDINFELLSYFSEKDKIIKYFDSEKIQNEIAEILFISKTYGKSETYKTYIKLKGGLLVRPDKTRFLKYIGFETPAKNISVIKYDDYNKTWVPAYIPLVKIDKIEFRHAPEIKNEEKKLSIKPSGKKTEQKKKKYEKKVLFDSDKFNSSQISQRLKKELFKFKNKTDGYSSSILLRVNFAFDSSRLSKKAKDFLNVIGSLMKSSEFYDMKFNIRGFTDDTGTYKYNKLLSIRRAGSVKKYFVSRLNIEPSRLISAGYGESMPVFPNSSDYYKSLNRRVEIYPVSY